MIYFLFNYDFREKETSILKEQIDKLNTQIKKEERRAEDLKIKAKYVVCICQNLSM